MWIPSLRSSLTTIAAGLFAALLLAPAANAEFGQVDEFGSFGSGNGEFTNAKAIAVDPNGATVADDRIYVLDLDLGSLPNRFRIEEFDGNGGFLRVLYSEQGNPFTFALTPGVGEIAINASTNRLYLTRIGSGSEKSRIQMFDVSQSGTLAPTNFVADTGTLRGPRQIAVDQSNGNVFVAGGNANDDPKIRKFDSSGGAVGALFGPEAPDSTNIIDPGEFGDGSDIDDLAVRNGGGAATKVYTLDLWTPPLEEGDFQSDDLALGLDSDAPRVQRFTSTGTNFTYDDASARPRASSAEFFSSDAHGFVAASLAAESNGDLLLAQADTDGVIKFNEAGTELDRFGGSGAGACEFSSAPGLAIGPASTLFAIDRGVSGGAPQRVLKFGEGGSGCSTTPQFPVAAFTISPDQPGIGQQVTFDASGSFDPDGGNITKYEWDLDGNGTFETNTDTNPVTTKTYNAAGPVGDNGSVTLRVTDDDAPTPRVDDLSTDLVIKGPPVAAFNFAPASPFVEQQVTFDGSGSTDPDSVGGGGIATYDWDLDGDGSCDDGTGSSVQKAFSSAGPVSVKLCVTDDESDTDTETKTVTVSASQAPTAFFTASTLSPQTNQQVNFNASSSVDPDGGSLTKFEWDLDGDGTFETNTGTTAQTSRSYATAGSVTVRLRVTDDESTVSAPFIRTLTVTAPANPNPGPPDGGGGGSSSPLPSTQVAAQSLKLPGGTITATGGVVKLTVTCGTGSACAGTIALQSAKAVAARNPVRAAAKKKIVKLGSTSYRVAAGAKATVQIKLSSKNQKVLKKLKKLAVKAIVSSTGAGASASTSSTFTLKPGKKK